MLSRLIFAFLAVFELSAAVLAGRPVEVTSVASDDVIGQDTGTRSAARDALAAYNPGPYPGVFTSLRFGHPATLPVPETTITAPTRDTLVGTTIFLDIPAAEPTTLSTVFKREAQIAALQPWEPDTTAASSTSYWVQAGGFTRHTVGPCGVVAGNACADKAIATAWTLTTATMSAEHPTITTTPIVASASPIVFPRSTESKSGGIVWFCGVPGSACSGKHLEDVADVVVPPAIVTATPDSRPAPRDNNKVSESWTVTRAIVWFCGVPGTVCSGKYVDDGSFAGITSSHLSLLTTSATATRQKPTATVAQRSVLEATLDSIVTDQCQDGDCVVGGGKQ
ncbi:hypothetical protein LTR62_004653 [Meristemomyces frigidus]|uniref:Uncharacterized protein n=1 Tax=Meristemomyces frigidus TaxID=1508187 RepID=A0AAN7TLV9_9PEZI|nr:hypothetical protein LTR62_004653 [Meristemomyces frigidus]